MLSCQLFLPDVVMKWLMRVRGQSTACLVITGGGDTMVTPRGECRVFTQDFPRPRHDAAYDPSVSQSVFTITFKTLLRHYAKE